MQMYRKKFVHKSQQKQTKFIKKTKENRKTEAKERSEKTAAEKRFFILGNHQIGINNLILKSAP